MRSTYSVQAQINSEQKYSFLDFIQPEIQKTVDELLECIEPLLSNSTLKTTENYLSNFIVHDLLSPLLSLVTPTIALEFNSIQARGYLIGETADERYQYFNQQLCLPENKQQLFSKYSLLLEKTTKIFNNFKSSYTVFFQSLVRDFDVINKRFFDKTDLLLDDICSSGDGHNGGHSTKILTFKQVDTNFKLIYKPHSLQLDMAMHHFYGWLNSKNDLPFMTYKILDRDDYGWCEFIEYKSCVSREEVERYYQRLGGVLAVSYVLCGYDLHCENIIAHGEYPVVIDNECFLTPFFVQNKTRQQKFRPLVSNILILPQQSNNKDEDAKFELSAMGSDKASKTIKAKVWDNYGSADIKLVKKDLPVPENYNIPKINDDKINISDYHHYFISGFTFFYNLLLANTEELLSEQSPLDYFCNKDDSKIYSRIIFRATQDYYILKQNSSHPRLLYNIDEHEDYLTKNLNNNRYKSELATAAESTSLKNMDIPYFYCKSDGKNIYSGDKSLLNIELELSGLDTVKLALSKLSQQDLNLQLVIIKNTLKYSSNGQSPSKVYEYIKSSNTESLYNNKNLLIDTVVATIDNINNLVVDDIMLTRWPSLTVKDQEKVAAGFTGADLYDGILGQILLSLYAGDLINNVYHDNTIQYFKSYDGYIRHLQSDFPDSEDLCAIGGYGSIGGGVLVCTQILELKSENSRALLQLDFDEVVASLNNLLTIGLAQISKDTVFDLIGGSGGYLMQLLKLKQSAAVKFIDKSLLDKSIDQCVEHLLINYIPDFEQNNEKISFSHGTLGISYVLSQYYNLTPEPRVLAWLKKAAEYEQHNITSFKPTDWLSSTAMDRFRWQGNNSWCHGTVGIGLAKIYQYTLFDEKLYAEAVDFALSNTQAEHYGSNNTSLCHGYLGSTELFLQAYQANLISKNDYEDNINELLANAIANNNHNASQHEYIGLMIGRAGFAYQILRLLYPDKVPSVLS